MSADESMVVEGRVIETLPGAWFLVRITTEGFDNYEIKAKTSGKMKMYSIKIVAGDWVKVELNPYELSEGRIVFRSIKPFNQFSQN
jgi:translation initiation factor IF-1